MGRKRKIAKQNQNSASKKLSVNKGKKPLPDQSQSQHENENENQSVLNPLSKIEILLRVLNHLDFFSLKKSRFVCKLWRLEGGKILVEKANLKLESFLSQFVTRRNDDQTETELETFLKTANPFASFSMSIKNITDPNRLENLPPLLLQRTKSLVLNHSWPTEEEKELAGFLELFPNLQVLCTSWERKYQDFPQETKKSLFKKFTSLKEIRLKLSQSHSSFLTKLLLSKKGPAANFPVKEMYLSYGINETLQKTYLDSVSKWPIDTLFYGFYVPDKLTNFRVFLGKISPTLKHLDLDCICTPNTLLADYLVPWSENSIIPSTLNRLKTLKLLFDRGVNHDSDASAEDFSWLLLTCAFQLPNLKKLWMDKVPQNLEERIGEWNNHLAACGRTLKSESLEELEIFQPVRKTNKIAAGSMLVFSCRLWPNLKSLRIENPPIDLPSSFSLSESGWIGLERLDLKFHYSCANGWLWTKWLTGRDIFEDERPDPDDSTFTIKDLKNLKHFGLSESRRSGSNCIATDSCGENDLKFMTQLQSLHLKNSEMSKKVKGMLKETLGPTVNIVFEN